MTRNANIQKPKRTRRLATSLSIAFALVSIFVVLVTQSLQLSFSLQYQQDVLSSRLLVIAQEASKTVSSFIEEQFSILETAIDVADLASISIQEKEAVLESVLGLQPAFRQLALLNNQDQQLTEVSRLAQSSSGKILAQLSQDGLAQIHQGQRYISSIYIDDATSEPLVMIALPVTDIFGDFQGTLAVEINLKFMWDLVDQLKVGETGYAYVVDNRGNLIAFGDTGRVLRGENVQYIPTVGEFVNNPTLSRNISVVIKSYTGLLGTKVVGTYVPLGTPGWAVVVEIPDQEAYQDSRAQGNWSLLSSIIITILAGLVGYLVSRQLAAPLIDLSDTATEIASGNLEAEAKGSGYAEIARVATTFNTMTSQLRDSIGSLEQRVADRTKELEESSMQIQRRASQLEAIAEVASSVATLQDVNQLLPYITKTISESFGFYHVGIFLLSDDKKFAVLHAANSEGGQKMLARKHQLRVGLEGIVGFSIDQKRARIALDVGEDAVFFNNPDLPATRSEMALPLIIGQDVIGVLDAQSEQPNAFSSDDIEVLGTLANQVAVAIENARLFEQSQHAFEELDNTFKRYIQNEWRHFPTISNIIGYRVNERGLEPIMESSQKNDAKPDKSSAHKVPITLRGVTIGSLGIDLGKQPKEYTQEEIDIIRATVERVAVALEGARLLKTSQRQAAKEQQISNITAKISASVNMRNVLQTAVEELGRSIPGSEIVIQFQSNQEKTPERKA